MPELANISKLLHVAIAFWFVGGLLGRTLAQRQARRSEEIRAVDALCSLAGAFDRLLVIPGAQLVPSRRHRDGIAPGVSSVGLLAGRPIQLAARFIGPVCGHHGACPDRISA